MQVSPNLDLSSSLFVYLAAFLTSAFHLSKGNPVSVTPKPVSTVKDTGPRRSLNLEDYKKKRGLI